MKGKFIGGVVCGIAGMILSVVIFFGGMLAGVALMKIDVNERKSNEAN